MNLRTLLAQLVDGHRAAAILDQKVETRGRSKSGKRRNIEWENYRLRECRQTLSAILP